MTPELLERRLKEWADEYRGGKYEHIGYPRKNMLAGLIEHQGFVPDSQIAKRIPQETLGDEIERLILAMLQGGMFRQAWCIRTEYLCDHEPEEQRLSRLSRMGLGMSRAHYYEQIRIGKAFMLGALTKVAA